MSKFTDQYFWDLVCRKRCKEEFLEALADEKTTLIPCEFCAWPSTIHYNGERCTRQMEVDQRCPFELYEKITKELQSEMLKRNNKKMEKVPEQSFLLKNEDFKQFLKDQQQQQNLFLEKLWEKKPVDSLSQKTTKLIKMSKPPIWTKDMSLDVYKSQLNGWNKNEKDVPESGRYNKLLESLKTNKDVRGVAKYINHEVTEKCVEVESQTVKAVIDALEKKYGRQL